MGRVTQFDAYTQLDGQTFFLINLIYWKCSLLYYEYGKH